MNYPKAQGSTLNWFRRKGRLKIVVKGAILRRHIGFADAKTGQRNQRSCALCGNSPHLSRVHPRKHANTQTRSDSTFRQLVSSFLLLFTLFIESRHLK